MISPILWEQIAFGDDAAWRSFLLDHARMHDRMYQQITGPSPPYLQNQPYVRYPLADGGGPAWIQANDLEHRAAASRIGIPIPPDLSSFDLQAADEFTQWMNLHAEDHRRLNGALGIS